MVDNDVEMGVAGDGDGSAEVFIPGRSRTDGNEELECDESAYVLYHQAQTGAPCLSFDVVHDQLGINRNQFPATCYIVAGTQAPQSHLNSLMIIKFSNLTQTKPNENENEDSDEDSDDDSETAELDFAVIEHQGCVNRVKTTEINNVHLAATWSELGKVYIWSLDDGLNATNDHIVMTNYMRLGKNETKPLSTFTGHKCEGYGLDWSTLKPGHLASGDCDKNIHLWKPLEGGKWAVDQRPYLSHTASVEDIQWSPNEAEVFASCSVDKTIKIWDARAPPHQACMLTTSNAHDSDVNVISWNKNEPFILSGGDDGKLKVWDLREFQGGKPVALFKHHTAPISTVEWHPSDSTVFAAGGSDNQITQWDLAVERDEENQEGLQDIPPQLLFIHQGQDDIKELHWHPQIPGLVISTAQSGFNVFKTISV